MASVGVRLRVRGVGITGRVLDRFHTLLAISG